MAPSRAARPPAPFAAAPPVLATLAALAVVACAPRARAASFVVDTTADAADVAPGDGACAIAPAGPCSLRAAVQEAAALPGLDSIALGAGVHALALAGPGEDAGATGDLDVPEDLEVIGAGRDVSVVTQADADRVFDVAPGASLTLRDVALEGGGGPSLDGGLVRARDASLVLGGLRLASGAAARGGAVFVEATAAGPSAALDDCVVADCRASLGGGLFIAGHGAGLSVALTGGRLEACTASLGGGGVRVEGAELFVAAADILGCTVTDPAASGGGAIDAETAAVAVYGSTLAANVSSGSGGAIRATGTVELRGAVLSDNRAARDGGGAWVEGSLVASGARLERNVAGSTGGGLWSAGDMIAVRVVVADNQAAERGGGVLVDRGVASIEAGTVSGNRLYGAPVAGAGIFASGSDLRLTNATISGNVADAPGVGGGLAVTSGTTRLANVTIAGNAAAQGGGLWATSDVETACGILAGNAAPGGGPACFGALLVLGPGLLDDPADCALSGDVASLLAGVDPLLAPLADNGGPTLTRAPEAGSPVLDAGNAGSCTDAFGAPLPDDQRGVVRPQDGDGDGAAEIDLGAVELESPCGADSDGDGLCDALDDCPFAFDPGQEDADGDGQGDACDPCPADPADACAAVSILRNASLATLTLAQHAALLTPGGDPVLDPVRDLYRAGAGGLPEVSVPGDALPGAGPLVFYEAAGSLGPLRVTARAGDVVLTGY